MVNIPIFGKSIHLMNFLQRRSHLFIWICITTLLAVGFILSAYHALQDPIGEHLQEELIFNDIVLDSIYVARIDTEFILKNSGEEKYILAKVLSPQAITTLKVFKGDQLLGSIDSKGPHILQSSGDQIGELVFVDLLTGKKL